MYTSVNSDKDVDDQVQIQMEELFKTPRLAQEEDTALHIGSSSHLGTASQAEKRKWKRQCSRESSSAHCNLCH